MSQKSKIHALNESRVGKCTNAELCDVLLYRFTSGDPAIPEQPQMSEAELNKIIVLFRMVLIEEYGRLPQDTMVPKR